MSEFFRFEKQDEDLPFYSGETKLSVGGAILLFICLALFAIPIVFPIPLGDFEFSMYLGLVLLLPTIYLLRGNLNMMFKKIRRSDIKIIVACMVLSLVYSFAMIFILEAVGIADSTPLDAEGFIWNLSFIISFLFQLMGEELFKILLFLFMMFLLYNFSHNRNVSFVISLIISMASFGLLHAGFYGGVVQVFLIQGLGSIFDFYGYFKTRNIFVPFIAHVLYDAILMIPT